MKESGSIADVLSGNRSIKVELGVDTQSMIWLGLTILLAALLAGVFANLISKNIS